MARETPSASSRHSYEPDSSVVSAPHSAVNSSSFKKIKMPEFKSKTKSTQRIDPESSMYKEDKLDFSQVTLNIIFSALIYCLNMSFVDYCKNWKLFV